MVYDKKITKEQAIKLAKAAQTMHYIKDVRTEKMPVKKKPTK